MEKEEGRGKEGEGGENNTAYWKVGKDNDNGNDIYCHVLITIYFQWEVLVRPDLSDAGKLSKVSLY